MRRIVSVLAVGALLAGCGATDWKSAQVPSSNGATSSQAVKSTRSPQQVRAAAAAVAAAKAERPYIDALVISATAQSHGVHLQIALIIPAGAHLHFCNTRHLQCAGNGPLGKRNAAAIIGIRPARRGNVHRGA